jgi:hypothetical protein
MSKSDRVLGTPPTNTSVDTSRRGFFAQAAVVVAGGAALGAALPLPLSAATSQGGPDPILAAIEVHRTAAAAIKPILDTQSALERNLPREKRQSNVDAWEEKIVETDDPRWIDAERAVHDAFDTETDAAIDLLNIHPTTMHGLIALLQYAVAADIDGVSFPEGLMSDDGKRSRSWQQFLLENIAEVLPDMVSA